MSNQVPVLLVIFNRPEKTRRVMDALRQVQPARLFVAADGPRPERPDDIEKCRLAREAATDIDWPCEVQTRFLEENVGCDPAVSSAITWFFQHVEHGVILEDDCVPHPDFFRFCADVLPRYKYDLRIMQVSSFAPYPDRNHPYDYHFSRAFRCWCWATWRRAWEKYSDSLAFYDHDIKIILRNYFPTFAKFNDRMKLYEIFRTGKRDNWDFKWNITCYAQNALCIVPEKNLMRNIGFDIEATHTVKSNPLFSGFPIEQLEFPLRHPTFLFSDERPEQNLEKRRFISLPLKSRCAWRVRHALGTLKDYLETRP